MSRRSVRDGTRSLRPVSTADRILDVAGPMFARDGYTATATREIAVAVGIRAPSLYAHFRSKEEILAALLTRRFRQLSDCLIAANGPPGSPASARLEAVVRANVRFVCADPDSARLTITEIGHVGEALRDSIAVLRHTAAQVYVDVIESGRSSGEFTVLDNSGELAEAIPAMIVQIGTWVEREGRATPEAIAAAYVHYALRLVGWSPERMDEGNRTPVFSLGS